MEAEDFIRGNFKIKSKIKEYLVDYSNKKTVGNLSTRSSQIFVTSSIEEFKPVKIKYDEITLIDCNDSFTHNLVQSFLKLGAPVKVFRSHSTILEEVKDGIGKYLVISPGPGTPANSGIAPEVYSYYKNKVPILGVCLGMQIINEIHGGRTIIAPLPVHGKTSKIHHDGRGIFKEVPNPTNVARYHSLQIDPSTIDIQSSYEGVIMAFRLTPRTAAVQFHPESFLTTHGDLMLQNFLEGRI